MPTRTEGQGRMAVQIEATPVERDGGVGGPVLRFADLRTQFATEDGLVRAVDGVSFSLAAGETVAVVGESGSGKSVTSLSALRLVDPPGRIAGGSIAFRRRDGSVVDLVTADERTMRAIRGNEIAMVFQEPMTSLNPVYTIGNQVAETVRQHERIGRAAARRRSAALLEEVGINDPDRRLAQYPYELSGGMRQRVMIAMALACRPAVLIADEPTTALDVTIQAQILDLLRRLQQQAGGMSVLFITHDMGVVAEIADRVVIMYCGRVVEAGPVRAIFRTPRHPYTRALLGSIPRVDRAERAAGRSARLVAIPGTIPNPLDLPPGCPFAPRCEHAVDACRAEEPPLFDVGPDHTARCIRWQDTP